MSKSNLTTYLVQIAYDGSNFFGWSRQPKLRTVEGEILRILKRVFSMDISIEGASRTDTGVHAYDQYFTFSILGNISLDKLKVVLKQSFKADIKIIDVQVVTPNYDLRKHVKFKEYHYYINIGENDPFKVNYEYQYDQDLNPDKLQTALNCFLGRNYFYNFSGLQPDDKKDPYRTIDEIKVEKKNHHIIISIKGRGFLRYQVRYIVSAAIKYCEDKVTIEDIKSYLDPKDQKKFPYGKVPASGLYLFKTTYQ